MQDAQAIDTKEIRGVNLKNLVAVVTSTIVICASVLGTRYSIENKIDKMEMQKQADDKYNDLRLRTMELKISAIEVQMKDISDRIDKTSLVKN